MVDYGFAGNEGRRGRVATSTPLMRLGNVEAWVTELQGPLAGTPIAQDPPGAGEP